MTAAAERALLDAGVLVAFLHADDDDHERAVDALRRFRGTLLTTDAVLAESMRLLSETHVGPSVCVEFFLRDAAHLVPSSRASLAHARLVLEKHADIGADFVDASLVALAEETDTWTILTLERRWFHTLRGLNGERFRIRP